MDFDITERTIFKTLTGSRLYGTYSEDSDYDYRGVAIAPIKYYFGYAHKFQQSESSTPDDVVVYDFLKFLKLSVDDNPNVIELLFVPERFWITHSPAWRLLVENRQWFLSKKCFHTFRGYAHSQMRRVLTHRGWLLQGELREPKREDYYLDPNSRTIPAEIRGAAEELVSRFLLQTDIEEDLAEISRHDKALATAFRQRLWEFLELNLGLTKPEIEDTTWDAAAKVLGFDTNFLDLLQREKKYRQARRHYDSWLHWKRERNQARKEIEARCGFDAKHMLHVFRLVDMCREILQDHDITVNRSEVSDPNRNADFLKAIKRGDYTFDALQERYKQCEVELNVLYETSTLQSQPRRNDIEALGVEIMKQYLVQETTPTPKL